MHTACVWSEKLPFAGYSVVKDHSGGNIAPRNLRWSRGAFPRTPLARFTRSANRRRSVPLAQPSNLSAEAGHSGPRRGKARVNRAPVNKVENTGLEPVTSWLQTRRSPS